MPGGQTIPARNKHVESSRSGMAQIKSGKVTSANVYLDNLGFIQQLGLAPPPPRAAAAAHAAAATAPSAQNISAK